jgi:hypothetical protein
VASQEILLVEGKCYKLGPGGNIWPKID